jgi:hypothetical protein
MELVVQGQREAEGIQMSGYGTPRDKLRYSGLHPSLHKYRVMKGDQIIGQFSNIKLAADTAHRHRGAVVLDVSVVPNLTVYRDGGLVEHGEQ